MKLGVKIAHFDWPGSPQNNGTKLVEIAKATDQAGFSSLWVMDHFFQISGSGFGWAPDPMLEGYNTLGYLAAVTQNMWLGLMATGAYHRYSGVLIKTTITLDVLSGSRANFGICAGWHEREARGLGIPYLVSSEQTPSTDSEWYHDCHERLPHKLQVLQQHCENVGQPYDEIEKTVLGTIKLASDAMSAAEVIDLCAELAEIGVQQAIFNMPNVHDIYPLEFFGKDIIPAVSEIVCG